jgi:uncharacterized protein (TIGR03066 family)
VVGFAGTARAQDDNEKKIVGTWVLDKSSGDLPVGSVVEFTKDGKLSAMVKIETMEIKIEGTYKVEKDKLSVKLKAGDMNIEETATITKLTDEVLELKDKDGKVDAFKKKAKK